MNYCSFQLPQVQGNSSKGLKHPITYPSLMSRTHARKRPHGCQDQLSVFGFYQLQQQADPVVLENPLGTRFFPPQDYEVVCSLGGRQRNWGSAAQPCRQPPKHLRAALGCPGGSCGVAIS